MATENIALQTEVKQKLHKMKLCPKDSYNDIISRLLEAQNESSN
jgi:predicted CopG family antitoxin